MKREIEMRVVIKYNEIEEFEGIVNRIVVDIERDKAAKVKRIVRKKNR